VIGYGPSRIEAYGIGELSRSRPSIPVGDQALTVPFGSAYRLPDLERVDGRPWLSSAITPANGGPALSPIVVLDT
jgi:hypothetical protein